MLLAVTGPGLTFTGAPIDQMAMLGLVLIAVGAVLGVLTRRRRDDGLGGANPAQGSGLIGLRDRVDALGGTIDIRSPRGEGTVVAVRLPLLPDQLLVATSPTESVP